MRWLWMAVCLTILVGGCTGRSGAADLPRSAAPETGLATLPQSFGLAARYPGDRDLQSDSAVVFVDDVETSTGPSLLDGFASDHGRAWNNRWDNAWGRVGITREAGRRHAGTQALELSIRPPGGAGISKYFSSGFDRLFLRYYIRYDEAFPGAHHVGGGLAAQATSDRRAMPGIRADGVNKFEVLLDHWSFDPNVPSPGYLVAYVYHMDQQQQWGEQFYPSGLTQPPVNGARKIFGPSFIARANFLPARGRWYCNELMVQANTPGQRDGRIAFWVDGTLVADFPGLRFRSIESLKLTRAAIGLYESRAGEVRRVWIDDVVVATAYIGPMTK